MQHRGGGDDEHVLWRFTRSSMCAGMRQHNWRNSHQKLRVYWPSVARAHTLTHAVSRNRKSVEHAWITATKMCKPINYICKVKQKLFTYRISAKNHIKCIQKQTNDRMNERTTETLNEIKTKRKNMKKRNRYWISFCTLNRSHTDFAGILKMRPIHLFKHSWSAHDTFDVCKL